MEFASDEPLIAGSAIAQKLMSMGAADILKMDANS